MKKIVIVLFFLSAAMNAYLLFKQTFVQKQPTTISQDSSDITHTFPFLSKRIFLENKNDIIINFMPLRVAIRDYISKQQADISLYFEYLPSGVSIGVHEDKEFRIASLLKIPIIIQMYQKIEKGEIIENQMLTLKDKHKDNLYGTFWKEPEGTQITIKDAIKKSLVDSDNTTTRLLYELLTPEEELEIFQELDAHIETEENKMVPFMSVKSYTSFLRSIYFSSFLKPEHSNEILQLLTQSSLHSGIRIGVEKEVKVAYKTGTIQTLDKVFVQNDCGIIYEPKRPYVLCIFVTRTSDIDAIDHAAYISKMIFGYIQKVNL